MRRCAWAIPLALALAAWPPVTAAASWSSPGSGKGYSKAQALSSGSVPTTTVSVRDVTVSWAATGGTVPAGGYAVKRYDTNGIPQSIGTGCSGTIAGLTCTEQAVPGGQWRYTVTPLNGNWRGVESGQSIPVAVASPSLTLTPTTVTSLPAAFTGQIAGFLSGQTVTFRLDNPTSGTILTGSITPSPIPANGTSSVSTTIPGGTAAGAHTVYAVGSGGDVAGAAVMLSTPGTSTISTSAWDVRDASAGAAAVNKSDSSAFANDGISASSGNLATAFSAARYVQYTYNSPLSLGNAVSSVSFNLSYAGTASGDTTCFYFDVLKASTGSVLATHGSSGSPVDCTTGTTFKSTVTALPELTSTDLANDLRIRVYARSSGKRPISVDLATVSGTSLSQAFTLYESDFVDSAGGTAAPAVPWSLYASDSTLYSSAASWAATFSATRYLTLSFPSYVPEDTTLNSVSFKHSYRSASSGANVCYYFEVYSSSTLIGTHGSAAAPVSCNSSNATWQTDTLPLPEVASAAAANRLSVKLYVNRNGFGKSSHDLAQLQLTFTR